MLKQFNAVYEDDALTAAVYGASPVGLVVMLYEGAIKAVNQARAVMQVGRFDEKSNQTFKAIDIIDSLRSSLDVDNGGEMAENLNDLYVYMKKRLLEASSKNDADIYAEVGNLLETILPAWQQIDRAGQPAGQAS
jgi:flagellar protein FliS